MNENGDKIYPRLEESRICLFAKQKVFKTDWKTDTSPRAHDDWALSAAIRTMPCKKKHGNRK